MKLLLEPLVRFFDEPRKGVADTSAINGVLGEDLGAAVFEHYMLSSGCTEVSITDKKPIGLYCRKQLDRWINVTGVDGTKVLYQCEIKNWTASSAGGLPVALNCDQEKLENLAYKAWGKQLKTDLAKKDLIVAKVLLPMRVPQELQCDNVEPLVIYWMPISNATTSVSEPLFKTDVKELNLPPSIKWAGFKTLNVFSVSLYLRRLLKEGKKELKLEMRNASRRVEMLKNLGALH